MNRHYHYKDVDGTIKFKYYVREVARQVAVGHDFDYIVSHNKKFGLTLGGLRKLLKDSEFLALVENINDKLDDEVARARKRLVLLSDKAINVVDEVLSLPMSPLTTKVIRDTAVDVIKQSGIGVEKSQKEVQPITINLVRDSGEDSKS